jgi:4-amino-4-deoxychorismate lyase
MTALINGREAGRIDPLDRGLHYGDGLFETLAIRAGAARFLDWHLERLAAGAHRLGIAPPEQSLLRAEIAAAAPPDLGVVKLIITRGVGERGYRPPVRTLPTRIVMGLPYPAYPISAWTTGVRLRWCQTRLGSNPALAGIKHLNRLEQVLARAEWQDRLTDEGLMMDERDHAIGGTQTNLLARFGDRWVTPALGRCGVAGVMRRAFMHWSEERGEPVIERDLPAAELVTASALLLTNALIGAWPVRELAGRALGIDARSAAFNSWVDRQ